MEYRVFGDADTAVLFTPGWISAVAGREEVLASRTVCDLSAGSGLSFENPGAHRLNVLSEGTTIYRVTSNGR
ncbi:MAG: hypothetical protein JWR32_2531 [Mycobacterium sp.]|nr:hypothetical protein [Mycobacterium sp.]